MCAIEHLRMLIVYQINELVYPWQEILVHQENMELHKKINLMRQEMSELQKKVDINSVTPI